MRWSYRMESSQSAGRTAGLLLVAAGVCLHALAWWRTGPGTVWGTWFYQVAWWSFIATAVGALRLAGRESTVVGWRLVLMMPWSVVWWLIFDLANLRLQNWYYVLTPPSTPARWAGFWTAFATVIPLTVVTSELLDRSGLFAHTRWRVFAVTARLRAALWVMGGACLVLPLLLPRSCFPLIWLFSPLLIEPWLSGRSDASLLRQLSCGRPAPLLRALVTGLIVGGLWELFNHGASSRWIYTVPGLETGKVFEMPLPGFLGFMPFAVGTISFWRCVACVMHIPPHTPAAEGAPLWRKACASIVLTLPLCAAGFAAVDARTVRSFTPRVAALLGGKAAGVFNLREDDLGRAEDSRVPLDVRERARRLMAMAWHRGMGLSRATELETLGIRSPEDLAHEDPAALLARWPGNEPPRLAEIRIWIAAARRRNPP